ncbi:MAG TPA: thioesterase family protein [Bacteroidota bacterium]|nr:thioesterase family protein [Bacteroidota bacterium]
MARTKLDLPPDFHFATELVIRVGDINYGGHLGNDAVLSLVHEARIRFLKQHQYTENNVAGVGIIMADAVVVYRSEGFHGDILTVEVEVRNIQNAGCDFYYRLSNRETGAEVARVKTGIVFYDYTAKKAVSVPAEFRKKFS